MSHAITTDAALVAEVRLLREAVHTLCNHMGARLTRTQVCERLGVHRNTLAQYIKAQAFPQPGRDGKWLLSEVIEWERQRLGN